MPAVGPLNNVSENDQVSLELIDLGKTINSWKSYDYDSDFLTAVDSWSFEVADEHVEELQKLVQNGQRISLKVNGRVCATGYVDQISIRASRSGGTSMHIRGRDALGPACDACVDPRFQFPETTTIRAFMEKLFTPFGFSSYVVDDDINLKKLTGTASTFTTNELKKVVEKQLVTPINSKFKPHPSEGVYEFGERIGKRYGFHIWAGVDGKTLHIGRPNFRSPPQYKLIHRTSGETQANNILDSTVTYDWSKQPSALIAEGAGGGGHFSRNTLKVLMVNELLSDSDQLPAIQALKKQYPNAYVIPRRSYLKRPDRVMEVNKFVKPIWLYDDESKTQEQLANYVRRVMAEYQSKFLVAHYSVPGHSQKGVTWAPNTMVTVIDEVNGINQDLWIKGRKFVKDRSGGTRTELECVLPFTMEIHPKG